MKYHKCCVGYYFPQHYIYDDHHKLVCQLPHDVERVAPLKWMLDPDLWREFDMRGGKIKSSAYFLVFSFKLLSGLRDLHEIDNHQVVLRFKEFARNFRNSFMNARNSLIIVHRMPQIYRHVKKRKQNCNFIFFKIFLLN